MREILKQPTSKNLLTTNRIVEENSYPIEEKAALLQQKGEKTEMQI